MIRRARIADAPAIAAVINSAFEVEREFREGDRTSTGEILRLIDTFLVYEQDERIAGAIHVSMSGTRGYFGMLAVDEKARKGGIGRSLLEAAEELCRTAGCTVMTLSTGEDRKELFPYYGKLGYRITRKEVSTSPAWKHPIVVVHMEKPL